MSTEPTTAFATAAAKVFLERHPSYIVNPHNAKLMSEAILKLVDEENADPASVFTYERAFQDCLQELELKEPEQTKSVEEMTPEELSALPPDKQDRLPADVLRKLANYELSKRWQKPQLSEHSAFLKETFEESGFAFSPVNARVIDNWMEERGLGYNAANLRLALCDCEDALTPSEKVLNDMSSGEFLETVVKPEHARRQSEQKPRQPNWPVGFRYTSWLHDQ